MADSGSDEVIDKVVCGICLEKYQQPKLLPCLHSFCLNCLEAYVEKNQQNEEFSCPLCEEITKLPAGGVKHFRSNFYLDTEIGHSTDENQNCDMCGPKMNAANHCTDCDENYCERCTEIHMKMKVSRNHTLLVLTQSDTKGIMPIKKRHFVKNTLAMS